MRTLSLCSGYGGLELGLGLAGWEAEVVAYAEIDPHASKVMAHRWPHVPNLGDLTQITDPPDVDVVAAGFPCQDISTAGRRAGLDGERSGLWWTIADLVGHIRPRVVVLENVAAIATLGGPAVVGTLAGMGYSVRWGTVRASDVGACHRRARWFAVAVTGSSGTTQPRNTVPTSDADSAGLGGVRVGGLHDRIGTAFGDNAHRRTRETFGKYAAAVDRWEQTLGRPAPDPTVGGRLSPRFVEWMMGLPAGWVTAVPDLSRAQQLRILGNGVVPQQAAHALQLLAYLEVAA